MNILILLEEFCHYSTYIKGYAPDTIKRYRQMVRFFSNYSKIETTDAISRELVHGFFLYGRTERNWSINTYISYHKTLLVFFRWCKEKKGVLEHNYVEEIELPKKQQRLPVKLTGNQALEILEISFNLSYSYRFLRYRNHAILATFIFCGLRKNELLNLRLSDVDIDNQTIFVRQGKGGKDRIIPMSFTLAQSLERYLVQRKRLQKTCPEFFTSLNRNKGFTGSGLKRLIEKIRTASNIRFTVHELRHTFATLMLEGGCDIFSLSKMLGHSDIKTTTIYLSATPEHLREQMGKHPLNLAIPVHNGIPTGKY